MPRRKNEDTPSDEPPVEVEAEEPQPEAASPAPVEPGPPVDLRPRFTAKQIFRASPDPVVGAFLHVEGLRRVQHGTRLKKVTRKLPREEWAEELKRFRTSER